MGEPEDEEDCEGEGGLNESEFSADVQIGAGSIEFFLIHETFELGGRGGGECLEIEKGGDEFEVPEKE